MRSVRITLSTLLTIMGLASVAWSRTGPVPGIPFIDDAVVERAANGDVTIRMFGHFPDTPPDSCWRAQPLSEMPPTLLIAPAACEDSSVRRFWTWQFYVGQLAPGHHQILITVLHQESRGAVDPIVYQGYFAFDIRPDSIPLALPYVEEIRIEPASLLPVIRSICPTDSIRVTLRGRFPNPCFSLERIEVFDATMTPVPGPPMISLTVDRGGCRDFCPEVLTPWSASVVLPPQAVGAYSQLLQMFEVDCALPDSVVARHATAIPFTVRDQCPPTGCLWPGFEHPNGAGACDAFVSREHMAMITFTLRSTEALAGLQGRFVLNPSKLRIVAMEPTGVAKSMHLNWVPTEDGARYTLFAESGAPIPGCDGDILDDTRCRPEPILQVTAAAIDPEIPGETRVDVTELLGSDISGKGVELCSIRTWDDPSRIAWFGARICAEPACDFNTDGRTDVRDLVLMVHCVNDSTQCPHPAFDCNRDSVTSIYDVICCAIHMLRDGRICPECPPDTTRPAPHVRAQLGEPTASEGAVEVPLSLIGAEFLGGAVLEFDFPTDRFDADVTLTGAPQWLELNETRDGRLAVGLVRTSPLITTDVDQRLDLVLRFTLKPGQTQGGGLAYARGEFSGSDGALLDVDLGSLELPLGGDALLSLSEPRPNPSAGETRFSLILDRAADVELGIYDLGGRRVATMHRGSLSAGRHDFTWRGQADRGGAAPNGIYFYRATGGGASVTRKLVLLRGR